MARLPVGHDAGTVAGADLGAVLVPVHVTSRTQCNWSSINQWPRAMAASSAGLAWMAVSEVVA